MDFSQTIIKSSLPKRTVGGRFPVVAVLVECEDGRLIQGIGRTAKDAFTHAEWRVLQWHGTDEDKDWFTRDWATFARSR
jgi:tRNA(Arg) A34 adenosine deaminase TadA